MHQARLFSFKLPAAPGKDSQNWEATAALPVSSKPCDFMVGVHQDSNLGPAD
jgi:hypothetical protein